MANAVGTNSKLLYVKEVTWGTTPASALTNIRFTSFDIGSDISSTESQELVTGREVQELVETDTKGGLTFKHELSYGNLDDLLETLFGAAWSTNVLKVGNTRKSLSMEAQFSDITQFCGLKGAIANSFDFSVAKGKIIDGNMGFTSKFPLWAGTTIGTGGPTAAPTNTVMDPIASIQLLQEGGAGSIVGPTEFSVKLTNNLIDFPFIGSADILDLQLGQLKAEGTFSCYFADRTYVDKFMAWTDTSIAATVGGAAAKKYAFLFSKVKLADVAITNIGVNKAVIAKVMWKAKTDATNTTVMVTRTP